MPNAKPHKQPRSIFLSFLWGAWPALCRGCGAFGHEGHFCFEVQGSRIHTTATTTTTTMTATTTPTTKTAADAAAPPPPSAPAPAPAPAPPPPPPPTTTTTATTTAARITITMITSFFVFGFWSLVYRALGRHWVFGPSQVWAWGAAQFSGLTA